MGTFRGFAKPSLSFWVNKASRTGRVIEAHPADIVFNAVFALR